MSFLLLMFSPALVLGWTLGHRGEPRRARHILGWSMGLIVLALIFGVARLATSRSTSPKAKVGLIASDAPGNVLPPDDDPQTERLLRAYAREAETLAARGAQVIVLPEKLGVVVEPGAAVLADGIFQSVVDRTGVMLVCGLIHVSANSVRSNQARVYAPSTTVRNYDKHHLLPPFESKMQPGRTLLLLPQPTEPWAVAICKDLDFTDLTRRYGQAGAGLLLVPAWDFDLDRWWHGHMAVMRGVENGFSVARAAKQGYLTLSDACGRILGEARSDSAPFATLLVEVPAAHSATLYSRGGDWFAWLSLATLAWTFAALFIRPRGSAAELSGPANSNP